MMTSGSATCGVVPPSLLAGDNTTGHPPGTKAGDVIHIFQSGSIQMVTDVSIDPAGNVWVANNWNSLEAAAGADPSRPHLDLGRRVGLHRHLWSGGPSEAAAHGQSTKVLNESSWKTSDEIQSPGIVRGFFV